ncbi:MAG: hypothetical protein HOP24_08215 [Sideroxydans sp.]|nr:hypothetical protein [Sideroxydans sp.]
MNTAMNAAKKYLSKWLVFLIQQLHTADNYVTRHLDIANPKGYDDLTPIDKADEDKNYSEALIWALKNPSVKNIAITGPYGSGKSSVLRTFEKGHKGFSYLNISLGAFKDDIQIKDTDANRNALIEKSVLQQVFYRIGEHAVPHSRFQRIKEIPYLYNLLKSSALALWLVVAGYVYAPNNKVFESLLGKAAFKDETYFYHATLITILGMALIINEAIRLFSNTRLSKVNFQEGDIEFDEDRGDSILNKHLDEILYFFEKTKFDVVVIEDLDRFDEVDIFVKLRELNTLINNSEQIARKIVFIYAIKDDVFKDANRTKFFDFIIPIIPVINTSNSGDVLLKKLSDSFAKDEIQETFVSDITLYIEDMRMLKNIYNEFVLYKNKLCSVGGIELPLEKLLGFIVYKNKYPNDFAKLNSNEGMVAEIFKKKRILIERSTHSLNTEIDKLKMELAQINAETLNDVKDLRRTYLAAIFEMLPNLQYLSINNTQKRVADFLDETLFKQLQAQSQIPYYVFNNNYPQNSNLTFKSIEEHLGTRGPYSQRELLINKKGNGRIEEIKKNIAALNEKVRDIKSSSLKGLIDAFPTEDFFDGPIKDEKLLTYLIRTDYINENYHDFISFFYEGSITRNDQEFLLSIKNQEPLEFTHTLVKIDAVIKRLSRTDYKESAALNFDLISTLLKTTANLDQLNVVLAQLCNNEKRSLEFIDTYLSNQADAGLLINEICRRWKGFWKCVSQDANYPTDTINGYLKLILIYAEIPNILNVNVDSSLTKYISEKSNFLEFATDIRDVTKLENTLAKLEVKFTGLVRPDANKELFEYLYKNSLYEINTHMVERIIQYFNPDILKTNSIDTSNFTVILQSKCNELISYVNSNPNLYVENVLLRNEDGIDEREDALLALLNNNDIDVEGKTAILNKQKMPITKITDIHDHELWGAIIQSSKVVATWENLLAYFGEKKVLDDALVAFVEQTENYKELAKYRLKETEIIPIDLIQLISKQILLSTELSDECYFYLIKCIPYWYPDLPGIEKLSNAKISHIISHGKLQFTEPNFNALKNHFNNQYASLVEKNVDSYLKEIEKFTLDPTGLMHLIKSKVVSTDQKITILNSVDAGIIDDNTDLVRLIFEFLLSQNSCPKLNLSLVESLVAQSLPIDEKVKLIVNQAADLATSEIENLLTLSGPPISGIPNNQKPTVENNETYKQLAEMLIDKGILSSFKEEDEDTIRMYPKKS